MLDKLLLAAFDNLTCQHYREHGHSFAIETTSIRLCCCLHRHRIGLSFLPPPLGLQE